MKSCIKYFQNIIETYRLKVHSVTFGEWSISSSVSLTGFYLEPFLKGTLSCRVLENCTFSCVWSGTIKALVCIF